jgi:hypothetical protein
MALPGYAVKVEIDADPDLTGVFIVGESLLGGADLLGGSGVIGGSGRWVEVPAGDVASASIRRGRADDSREYDAGTCTVTVYNSSGDYDPDNAQGAYVAGGVNLLTVGTGLRVTLTPRAGGTAAVVFTGFIDGFSLDHDQFAPTVAMSCVDWLAMLGRTPIPPMGEGSMSGDTTVQRAAWLLDAAGVPAAARDIDGDRSLLGWAGGGTARSQLERLARGEAGRARVTREGVVALTVHADEYGKWPAVAFTDRPA